MKKTKHDGSSKAALEYSVLRDDLADMTDKQRQIYHVALDLFAEKGFSATSTSEIAGRAGVAEALIFKHFKSKKNLLFSIARPVITKIIIPLSLQRLDKILSQEYPDIRVFLHKLFHERIEFAREHVSFLRIFLQEVLLNEELKSFIKTQVGNTILPKAIEFIKRHQKKKYLRKEDPATVLRVVMSSLLGYIVIRVVLFPELKWNDEREINDTIEIIYSGIKPEN